MIEKYLVKKITEPVDWKVNVPGSKSMTNRALLMAVLSAGTLSGVSCGARLYSGDRGRKKVRDRDGLRRQDSPRGGGNRRRKRRDSGAFSCGDARIFGRVL